MIILIELDIFAKQSQAVLPTTQVLDTAVMASQPNPVPGYPPNYSEISTQTIPADLELLQAHVYFRHGERTPVKERLTHLGIPSQWNMCGGRIDKPGSLW